MWQDSLNLIKNLSDQATGILVVLNSNPKNEHVAAALALAKTLQDKQKNVVAVSTADLAARGELQRLPALDLVKDQVANKDLDIVFDYNESAVDKVSYHIDDATQKFHLVIQPKRGFSPLDTSSVQFQYAGAAADLIITVGVDSLEDLYPMFPELSELTETANIIAIHQYESTFGTVKLASTGLSCVTELAAYVCQSLSDKQSGEVATLLLAGIEEGTQGFAATSMSAETFQLIASLLKAGGQRLKISKATAANSGNRGFAAALGQRSAGVAPVTPSSLRPVLGEDLMPSPLEPMETPMPKKKPAQPKIQQLRRDEGSRNGG